MTGISGQWGLIKIYAILFKSTLVHAPPRLSKAVPEKACGCAVPIDQTFVWDGRLSYLVLDARRAHGSVLGHRGQSDDPGQAH